MGEALTLHLDERCANTLPNIRIADLSEINQHIAFLLDAAARFDELLHDSNSYLTEQANRDIATSQGVR